METSDLAREGTPAAFRSRVDDVFGQLQRPESDTAPPAWSLSQQQVFRPGREEAYSSDEERAATEDDRARQELLPGSLIDFEGDDDEFAVKPSTAFCRGLDREDEYDASDDLAVRSGRDDLKPDRHTQVLADNVYEHSSSTAAGHSDRQRHAQRSKGTAENKHGSNSLLETTQLDGRPPPATSRVPDHVRNPHKYTCYVLDEPLLVGGGGGGTEAAQPLSGQPLAVHAVPLNQATPPVDDADAGDTLAGAGAGKVQFRANPRARGDRMQTEAHQAVSAVNAQTSASVSLAGEEDAEAGDDDAVMDQITHDIPQIAKRRVSHANRRPRQRGTGGIANENTE